jgi:hypothetical protein
MPSLITHYLCGEKSISISDSKPVKDIIANHRQAFNLGTQGPDIFFFYGILHLPDSAEVNEIAELIHHEKISLFFHNTLDYMLHKAGSYRELLASYLLGFACHYALDCSTHPYINYRSGFLREGEAKTHKYSFYHHKFEKSVDFLMLEREKGVRPSDIRIHKYITVLKEEARLIGNMYEEVLYKTYGTGIESIKVSKAITYMERIYCLLRDKNALKSIIFKNLSSHFDWARLAASYIYPNSVPAGMDYLNLNHKPWCLPWDKSVTRTKSFVDLFDVAALESKDLFEIIRRCLYDNLDIEKAVERIGNRSFSTGEDCTLKLDLKYYDCIFEQG